jgi:ATP/maltotriose-dependent transcriptional regulator MalT
MLMQAYPILQTKLYVPPVRPELVSRPRLIERLNAGLHRKLTLVSAPAGFGKTALLRDWLAARGWPAAWLTLQDADNTPGHFLLRLAAACRPHLPGIAGSILPCLGGERGDVEDGLAVWLNALAAREEVLVVVLDRYEQIVAPAVHALVARMLDCPPPCLHLFLTSRAVPPLPLPRLRVRRQLLEVKLAGWGEQAAANGVQG